ncbi:MAG: hypothetical protein H8E44_40905 [Planctomycetes bacterium]|nr:hypothetical protein [Planctomycetota bacterium]
MSWINRIVAALVLVCVVFSVARPAIAQPYWCPVCGGNTHHYDGHPHFQPPSNGGGTTRPRSTTDGVVTIYNRSSSDIRYYIQSRSGGGWSLTTVKARGSHWHSMPQPANFRIQFDSSRASGSQNKTYNLSHNVVKRGTATADAGRPYHFKEDSQGIRFHTSAGKPKPPKKPPLPDFWRQHQQALENVRRWEAADELAKRRAREDDLAKKRAAADKLAKQGDHLAGTEKYAEAIEAYQDSLNIWHVDEVQTRLTRAKSQLEEQRRLAKEEADRLTREKVSGQLSDLANRFSGNSGAGGGLDFDGTSTAAGTGGLDFSGGSDSSAVGQLEFSKGSQGSAPVPLDVTDFDFDSQSRDGVNAIAYANRLKMQRLSQRGPPKENSDHALPNPLDEERIQRERELIKPLNMVEFSELDRREAIERANARVVANGNEALRQSRTDLEEAWNKLREEGQLGADENPWKKAQNDTAFKAKFDAVLQDVAEKEDQRTREADEGWYRDMKRWAVWKSKKPELEPLIDEITVKLDTEREDDFEDLLKLFDYQCFFAEASLFKAGILKKGENAWDKASQDSKFEYLWMLKTSEFSDNLQEGMTRVREEHKKKWIVEIQRLEAMAGIAE